MYEDPMKIIRKEKLACEIEKGQWIFFEQLSGMLLAFQKILRKEVKEPLGYKEFCWTRLQTKKDMDAYGWLRNNADELLKVEDYSGKKFERFLDPLRCTSFYRWLKIKSDEEPINVPLIKAFEVLSGPTYRCEKRERLDNISTAIDFLDAELVYFGIPEEVKKIRSKTVEKVVDVLDKLKLDCRTVDGSPCLDLKDEGSTEKPALEVQCYIQFSGEWMEIGDGIIAFDRLVKNFGIRTAGNSAYWSGCQGFGFNRVLYCFLAQHGFSRENWPEYFIKFLDG